LFSLSEEVTFTPYVIRFYISLDEGVPDKEFCNMSEKDFIEKMVELMDTEQEVALTTKLEDIEEWDSLSYVAFLAMCNGISSRRIMPKEVKAATTINDLYELIKGEA